MRSFKGHDIYMCAVQYDRELKAGEKSVLDLAPVAARLGLRGVEYRDVYWTDVERELPAVRDQLVAHGLDCAYATFTPLFSDDPVERARLRQVLAEARDLGARLLRVFRGQPTGDGEVDAPRREAGRAIVALAATYGVPLALENHIGHLGHRLEDVVEVLQRFDSPFLGANVDLANFVCNGQDPLEAIAALSPRIIYCHLKDVRQSSEGPQQTYLGNGSMPLPEILAAMVAVGGDFPMAFEFGGEGDPEGNLRRSMEYLARLAGEGRSP